MKKITIGKLAQMAGVGVETVRFYQRKEILRIPGRSYGSFRSYSEEDAQRIIFIKKAQELGFSLAEVKEFLDFNTKPRVTCSRVKAKAEKKLVELEKKIQDLEKIKGILEKIACACEGKEDDFKQFKVQDCFDFPCEC